MQEKIRIRTVGFAPGRLVVEFADGRRRSVPLSWFPRLANAPIEALQRWQLIGGGVGVHWPDLGENLSAEGLLRGRPVAGGGGG